MFLLEPKKYFGCPIFFFGSPKICPSNPPDPPDFERSRQNPSLANFPALATFSPLRKKLRNLIFPTGIEMTTVARRTYAGDYAMGKAGENATLPLLNQYFQTTFNQQPRYSYFDFICKNNIIYFELKTRNCRRNSYPTLWINYEKVEIARKGKRENPDRRYFFAFKLSDGVFFIEYEEQLFKGFTDGWFQRTDRDVNDPSRHILNIPVEHLRQLIL